MPISVMKYTPQYHVACQIQRLILSKMGLEFQMANQVPKEGKSRTELSASELASLTKSWEILEERKRILRGKGLPKPVEVEKAPKAKRATFTE